MKYLITLFVLVVLFNIQNFSQDTFSIVAVDTVTGEIGSAGASCVSAINGVGAYIISDVIEGVGAIHTQASWLSANQVLAHQQMILGKSPQEIIDFMVANDVQGNPSVRQYGIVDLTRGGISAAYTGNNTQNYKNHAAGLTYSIQGNILLGQVVIDTITNTFLRTTGPLADRLMQALEGAKIVGADTRCAVRNSSSRSSFIKVVRKGDGNNPYLLKIIPDSQSGQEPIVLLRTQYDIWKDSMLIVVDPFLSSIQSDKDTISANGISSALLTILPKNNSDTLLSSGKTITFTNTGMGTIGSVTDSLNGKYYAQLTAPNYEGVDTISAMVISDSDTVNIFRKIVVVYKVDQPTAVKTDYDYKAFNLKQNYPNPFNPTTIISYYIPIRGNITIELFTVLGKKAVTLVDGYADSGEYTLSLTPEKHGLAAGVYFCRLKSNYGIQTIKLTYLK